MSEPEPTKKVAKPKRQRRNFAAELQALQARVDTAKVLLRRAETVMGDGSDGRRNELLGVALEILMGDGE